MPPTIHTQDADLPVTERFDVYPKINSSTHIAYKTYKDKVVLITGASRGIGKELVVLYVKAGASLVLAARNQKLLEEVKREILLVHPVVKVVSVVADVADVTQTEAVVTAGVDRFGKLDVVIANAGKLIDWEGRLGEQDSIAWWSVFEVNLRGVHSLTHFTLPHLVKTDGYFVAMSSLAGIKRLPNGSSDCLSKHAINRFVEFIPLEYPNVKAFALNPDVIATDMNYVSATWDLGEVRQIWKEKIEKEAALVSKLAIPA